MRIRIGWHWFARRIPIAICDFLLPCDQRSIMKIKCLVTTLTAFLWLLRTCIEGAPFQPNILFIMSDDHTTQAIGAYGGRLAALNPTPTLDRLARDGMLFTHAYCNNSICTPSRASILTGQ